MSGVTCKLLMQTVTCCYILLPAVAGVKLDVDKAVHLDTNRIDVRFDVAVDKQFQEVRLCRIRGVNVLHALHILPGGDVYTLLDGTLLNVPLLRKLVRHVSCLFFPAQ